MLSQRPKAFIPVEDQGYLIVVDPDPRRHDAGAHHPGHGPRRLDRPEARGRQPRRPDSTASTPSPASTRRTAAPPSSSSSIGRSAPPPSSGAAALARRSSRRILSKEIREAIVLVFQPPPIRGLGTTGGFEFQIEDRAGKGRRGAGRGHRRRSSTEARKRPELVGVFTPFSASVPQLRFDLDRVKARTPRSPRLRRLRRPPDQPRRLLRQRLQPLRQGLEGHASRPRAAGAPGPTTSSTSAS